ncbi:MAG: DUF493 domain-containing protein [Deltaproteobacteria bacterium]|nr:MAG: DUF493 domain-containing protein [Deltaproteobacteria bacterium]
MSQTTYDEEAARLAALPRAQRFEELMDFPQRYALKLIGGGALEPQVLDALAAIGVTPAEVKRRASSKGNYTALTVEVDVVDGADLDRVYTAVEGLEAIRFML